MSKHTPGPWHLDGMLVLSDGHSPRTVATVAHDQQGLRRGMETSEANALLIAAAPDLLEACMLAMKATSIKAFETMDDQQAHDAIVAAITKATADSNAKEGK